MNQNVSFNCRLFNDNTDENITTRRTWHRSTGQWLGPFNYDSEKLIGTDNRYRFQSYSTNDQATILRIKNLTTSDEGIYFCSVWLILNNETIISKNQTFSFTLTILPENGSIQNNELITSTIMSINNGSTTNSNTNTTAIIINNQTLTAKTTTTTLMTFLTLENDAEALRQHSNDNNVGINTNDSFDDNSLMDNVNEQQIYYENEIDDEDESVEDGDEVELPDLKDQEVWNIPLNCK